MKKLKRYWAERMHDYRRARNWADPVFAAMYGFPAEIMTLFIVAVMFLFAWAVL